ncbi:L,D-transpeptidase [Ancylobacter sp. 6x-1]|uniref:L,D-transpeptidase n=1 Tax=Ancylobacter crimeensis TaxID=2579147 RepID=A0ABT0DFT5_9HYPH|nr:L,D-transpeptidase [Ancylobacter crimeensis]MCK0198587.1 L,D-transpeptidase [Ancylobacter crimeensis]
MSHFSRRSFLTGVSIAGIGFALAGCQTTSTATPTAYMPTAQPLSGWMDSPVTSSPLDTTGPLGFVAADYGPVQDKFPIAAVDTKRINPKYQRQEVSYITTEPAGTIVVDPQNKFLYYVEGGGRAIRYGVGVGKQGFSWSGVATINSKQEWPDWYPPKEMIERRPDIKPALTQLQSGTGMHGGPGNPLGARAMYLWQNNKDTLYRIHGTVEPYSIGSNVSSGCIRMINQDAIDLYSRVTPGTRVVVLGPNAKTS